MDPFLAPVAPVWTPALTRVDTKQQHQGKHPARGMREGPLIGCSSQGVEPMSTTEHYAVPSTAQQSGQDRLKHYIYCRGIQYVPPNLTEFFFCCCFLQDNFLKSDYSSIFLIRSLHEIHYGEGELNPTTWQYFWVLNQFNLCTVQWASWYILIQVY